MEIPVEINITKVRTTVTVSDYPRNSIVGFASIELIDNNEKTVCSIRGFMIRAEAFKGSYFDVIPPKYGSKPNLRAAFVFNDIDFWRKLEREILDEFHSISSGKSPSEFFEIDIPDNL